MAPPNGTQNNDTLLGTDGPDTLDGGNGQDLIRGLGAGDSLDGGAGDDTVDGGSGDDILLGGSGQDRLSGEDGDDRLFGGQGDDRIAGGAGDDSAEGGQGQDLLEGAEGNDTLRGDQGDDQLDGSGGDDVLEGGENNDRLFGGAGADRLTGGSGDDQMEGDAGRDSFFGGAGSDRMFGGADRDLFEVGSSGGGDDVIDGGSTGEDLDVIRMEGTNWRVLEQRPDSDGNGFDGVIGVLDANGQVRNRIRFANIERIICFAEGTRIATPRGEVPVEQLRPGDRVVTRDSGLQELRWIGRRTLDWRDFAAAPHLRPILLRQGSLGDDLPERDMMVSPNHRLLVANARTALYFAEQEVLVAAKHLIDHRGIVAVDSLGTTYVHLLFDRHEVVLGNGAWSESFQPGDWSLQGLGNAQRQEILELFPALATAAGVAAYPAARRTLKRHEASLLRRRT